MPTDIHAMVRESREAVSLTQEEFAETVGISPRYLQHLECYDASPSLDLALTIADESGVLNLERRGQRFYLIPARSDARGIHLDRIDRSPAAILMKLAEELREGAVAVDQNAIRYINRLGHEGEDTEILAAMYEQAVSDVRTAINIVSDWFERQRPDVAMLGDERHRAKMRERGYATTEGSDQECTDLKMAS